MGSIDPKESDGRANSGTADDRVGRGEGPRSRFAGACSVEPRRRADR